MRTYLHDRCPEVNSLRPYGTVPKLSESAFGWRSSGIALPSSLRDTAEVVVAGCGLTEGLEGAHTEAGRHAGQLATIGDVAGVSCRAR